MTKSWINWCVIYVRVVHVVYDSSFLWLATFRMLCVSVSIFVNKRFSLLHEAAADTPVCAINNIHLFSFWFIYGPLSPYEPVLDSNSCGMKHHQTQPATQQNTRHRYRQIAEKKKKKNKMRRKRKKSTTICFMQIQSILFSLQLCHITVYSTHIVYTTLKLNVPIHKHLVSKRTAIAILYLCVDFVPL